MSNITIGVTTIHPDLITLPSYSHKIDHRPIVHEILNGDEAHTLTQALPESGTIEAVFSGPTAESRITSLLLATKSPAVLRLDDDVVPARSMNFIIAGILDATMQPGNKSWLVKIPYKKVD